MILPAILLPAFAQWPVQSTQSENSPASASIGQSQQSSAPNKQSKSTSKDDVYGGIGMSPKALRTDGEGHSIGPLLVNDVYKGTPAEASGLRINDTIVAIDRVATKGMLLDTLVSRIRGPVGTSVRLSIMREGFTAPVDYQVQRRTMVSRQFGGIGISLHALSQLASGEKAGPAIVQYVNNASPAEKAGIRIGDTIIEINSLPTRNMSLDTMVTRLRGEAGTTVTITVKYPGGPKPVVRTAMREMIKTAEPDSADTLQTSGSGLKTSR